MYILHFTFYISKLEIVLCVVVCDVLNHLVHTCSLIARVWHLAILDVGGDEVAEDATEIFVTRVGEERARVGQHTHKSAQQTEQ
mgnify:CR=1 FL=1